MQQESFCLFFLNKRNWNFEKHACQNMVAMETSSHEGRNMSYQIVARQILEKVAKFGSVCFNI